MYYQLLDEFDGKREVVEGPVLFVSQQRGGLVFDGYSESRLLSRAAQLYAMMGMAPGDVLGVCERVSTWRGFIYGLIFPLLFEMKLVAINRDLGALSINPINILEMTKTNGLMESLLTSKAYMITVRPV